MSDFVGKDSRGLVVVFPAVTWAHAEPHQALLQGKWLTVIKAVRSPELILDNKALPRPGHVRTADERYVRYSTDLMAHVVVPMKIIDAAQHIQGYGTVPAGTRIATSAYTSASIPNGAIIWSGTGS